jgi:multidrug resistance efflux pump
MIIEDNLEIVENENTKDFTIRHEVKDKLDAENIIKIVEELEKGLSAKQKELDAFDDNVKKAKANLEKDVETILKRKKAFDVIIQKARLYKKLVEEENKRHPDAQA